MGTNLDIAFSDYVTNVRCSARSAAVLAKRLQLHAPPDRTPELDAALRTISAKLADVAAVQAQRERLGPARLRPALTAFANAWSALHESLLAMARLPSDMSTRSARSLAILRSVFADGVSFTTLDGQSAWAEGDRRITRLRDEGHMATLEAILGPEFFAVADRATKDLAETIGTGLVMVDLPAGDALQEALWTFGHAVGNYGRLMVAQCDEQSPASVERFLRAMAPIDAHRLSLRNGGSGDEEETDVPGADPTTPVVAAPTPTTTTPVTPVITRPSPAAPNPFITAEE